MAEEYFKPMTPRIKRFDLPYRQEEESEITQGSFQPMERRPRFDDDERGHPPRRSKSSDLEKAVLFRDVRQDSKIIIKIDKEKPTAIFAANNVPVTQEDKVVVLNESDGAVTLALALSNQDGGNARFSAYSSNLGERRLMNRNFNVNFGIPYIENLSDEDLEVLCHGNNGSTICVINVSSHDSLDKLYEDLLTARRILETGGTMYLFTHKNYGAETQKDLAREVFGQDVDVIARGMGGYRIIAGQKKSNEYPINLPLDKEISFSVLGQEFHVASSPGLFSTKGLDGGTRILLENLEVGNFNRLLDVGCGWGAIGLVAATLNPEGEVVMTDIDTRATRSAQNNTERLCLTNTQVVAADDLISQIRGFFDQAASNPPFHAPYKQLEKMFKGVRERLAPNGIFTIVVENSYVPKFDEILKKTFKSHRIIDKSSDGKYSVMTSRK